MFALAKLLTAALAALFMPQAAAAPAAVAAGQQQPYSSATAAPYQARTISQADGALLADALSAARARDVARTLELSARINDPTARKIARWALIDTSGSQLSYAELARDRTLFAAWPRAESRNADTERALERAGAGAAEVLSFFGDGQPTTIEGAMALAGALEQSSRTEEARTLIRTWWRDRSFDHDPQTRALARYGRWLTQDDHNRRLDMLLLGPHGPATRAMVDLASPDRRAVAQAQMTLRTAYDGSAAMASLTASQLQDPGVTLERVRQLRQAGRDSEGLALLANLPPAPTHQEGQDALWAERRNYFLTALRVRNWQAAYHSMAGHGFTSGDRMVDGEFFAGWVALTKLNDPARAARHFETLRTSSSTPITQGRAYYWLGRAAEAAGDTAGAQAYYRAGGAHIQSFYGQLAAEKAGFTTLTLPPEPQPTDADRAAFEANEIVRAARILADINETSLFNVFAFHLDDQLPNAEQLALLMDAARGYDQGFTAMMVGRAASQRGFLLPERAYPIRIPPSAPGAPPLEFTLAITRQESSFDPRVVSSAGARGMMQFLPSTASGVARRLGVGYSPEMLFEPDYNMRLGSYHLGELIDQNAGSYILAAVGYNAGPARPPQWVLDCGDPRGGRVDPVDFIECTPFTETRNYMMRVMENMQIYRARLNNGTGQLTPSADLARGYSGPRPYMAN